MTLEPGEEEEMVLDLKPYLGEHERLERRPKSYLMTYLGEHVC
jgi:hypothetical protein